MSTDGDTDIISEADQQVVLNPHGNAYANLSSATKLRLLALCRGEAENMNAENAPALVEFYEIKRFINFFLWYQVIFFVL